MNWKNWPYWAGGGIVGGGIVFLFGLFLYGCMFWGFRIEYWCGGLYFSLSPTFRIASILFGIVIGALEGLQIYTNKKSPQ